MPPAGAEAFAGPPITVVSGFLGAGKTTLLKNLLLNTAGLKIGVLVNDVAALNIDAMLIARELPNEDGDGSSIGTVELGNGCVCCSLRDELAEAVAALLARGPGCWDHIVIEASGVSEPAAIRATLERLRRSMQTTSFGAVQIVTVADTPALPHAFVSFDTLIENRALALDEFQSVYELAAAMQSSSSLQRLVVDVLVEQLEAADVVLLNKVDLLPPGVDVGQIERLVQALNPEVRRILPCTRCEVPPHEVFDAMTDKGALGLQRDAQWQRGIVAAAGPATPPSHVRGRIQSFVYERNGRPFDPARLSHTVTTLLPSSGDAVVSMVRAGAEGHGTKAASVAEEGILAPSLLRSKGFCWLACSEEERYQWSYAGTHFECTPDGPWEEKEVFQETNNLGEAQEREPADGGRCQQLVFIGVDMERHKHQIEVALDACLLRDQELELYEMTDDAQRRDNFPGVESLCR